MSIEAPEARILSEQMNREISGKTIKILELREYQKLQRIGFINRDIAAFDHLKNQTIESVISRGNVVLIRFRNALNLVLSPEYGGKILLHRNTHEAHGKFHLKLGFCDGTFLTVALSGMGVIQALDDSELNGSYIYRRDFSAAASPLSDEEFTETLFSKQVTERNANVKAVLVGKEAVVVGISNSTFQDVIYRARIHPKKKASDLTMEERHDLFKAIRSVMKERILQGGKEEFVDLNGKQGRYLPAMGPNWKGKSCPKCKTPIEKLSIGGGQVYFCPHCQSPARNC